MHTMFHDTSSSGSNFRWKRWLPMSSLLGCNWSKKPGPDWVKPLSLDKKKGQKDVLPYITGKFLDNLKKIFHLNFKELNSTKSSSQVISLAFTYWKAIVLSKKWFVQNTSPLLFVTTLLNALVHFLWETFDTIWLFS